MAFLGHNQFTRHLRSPKGSWVRFGLWYGLAWINLWTVNKPHWEETCWDYIKCELFYVAGQCRHSGNCCQQLSIIRDGGAIKTIDRWEWYRARDKSYHRFEPMMTSDRTIKYFSCSSLSADNMCMDYEGRPHFCKTYPYSNFIRDNLILADCGYRIAPTNLRPVLKHPGIQSRYDALRFNNDLI